MRKLATGLAWAAALATAGACNDPLDVSNVNSPDVERAYSSPALIEQLISTTFQQIHQGLHASSDALNPQFQSLAFETYGSVANFGLGMRASLPRGPVVNTRNNTTAVGNLRDFSTMSRRARES